MKTLHKQKESAHKTVESFALRTTCGCYCSNRCRCNGQYDIQADQQIEKQISYNNNVSVS